MTITFFNSGTTTQAAQLTSGTLQKNQSFSLIINVPTLLELPVLTKGTLYDIQVKDDNGNILMTEPAWKYQDNAYLAADISGVTTIQNVQLFFGK